MKKNRLNEPDAFHSNDRRRKQEYLSGNIPVLLIIGLCLLAFNIFAGKPYAILRSTAPESLKNSGHYIFITGSAEIKEGLYFLTPAELRESFPELLSLVSKSSPAPDPVPRIEAIQYQSDLPRTVNLPPAVSNIFFLPIPINNADKEILSSLPGIGPVLAERIIQRRVTAGPYKSKYELLQIAGIGPKKLAKLTDRILID